MSTSFWTFANPHRFMQLSERLLPWMVVGAVLSLATGLVWGFGFVPPDYQQGDTIKIFFLHVPSAMMAVNIYAVMVVASIIGFVRRHHVSNLVAKAAAPIGTAFTIVAIVTGALWGKPMWGTWWVWDARLTAVLILLFFYIGYIALWNAIDEPEKAADLAAILCLVGSVFAFLSRYAVMFWSTLHQGASLSLDKKENVADVFWYPTLVMILGVYLLFIALLLIGVRTEIRARRIFALRRAMA